MLHSRRLIAPVQPKRENCALVTEQSRMVVPNIPVFGVQAFEVEDVAGMHVWAVWIE